MEMYYLAWIEARQPLAQSASATVLLDCKCGSGVERGPGNLDAYILNCFSMGDWKHAGEYGMHRVCLTKVGSADAVALASWNLCALAIIKSERIGRGAKQA